MNTEDVRLRAAPSACLDSRTAGVQRRWRTSAWRTLAAASLLAAGCTTQTGGDGGDDLFASPGTGNAPGGPGGAVVAVLELEAPSQSKFVLRGTIPVPPDTFPRPDGLLPFSIRNSDGNVVPTQVETVARYADDSQGASVIEVLGSVDRPAGVSPGMVVQYQVVDDPHPTGPLPINPALVDFLLTAGNATLIAEDVFGNKYGADIFKNLRGYKHTPLSKLLKRGQASVQVRTFNTMLPKHAQHRGALGRAAAHVRRAHVHDRVGQHRRHQYRPAHHQRPRRQGQERPHRRSARQGLLQVARAVAALGMEPQPGHHRPELRRALQVRQTGSSTRSSSRTPTAACT